MNINSVVSICVLCVSILISPALLADMSLKKDVSQVNFISVKNEHIAEVHSFDEFSGTLSDEGNLKIEINLVSVNTLIPIRNERMQKMLFDVSTFAVATFVANINKSIIEMPIGTSKTVDIVGQLTIKGKTNDLSFSVSITSLADGQVSATTVKPTLINVSQFGLDDGIDALQKIAMLKSISKSVPLTFNVIFQ